VQLAEDGALPRWFDRQADGSFQVRPEVRQMVSFGIHNLLDDPPVPPGQADLILCRNVTIYFGRETTRGVVGRLAAALRTDGWLLLGAAETLWQISEDFEVAPLGEAFGYRRLPAAAPLAALPRPGADLPRALPKAASRTEATTGAATASPALPGPRVPRSSSSRRPDRASSARPALPPGPVTNEQLAGSFLASARESLAIGRYDDALESAERAFATDPLLSDAYLLAGYLQCTLGRDDLAIDPLRKALFLTPGAGHAHFLLGAALRRVGDRSGALRSFRAAAQTLPHTPAADVEPLLDGRPLSDLIALCRDLAESEVTP
jgi:chemotaxis protein methyltransferase CheR